MDGSSTGPTPNTQSGMSAQTGGTTSQDGAQLAEAKDTAKERLADVKEQAAKQASKARDTVKQEIRDVRDDVERKTADRVNRQKHQVADRMDAIVHALDSAQTSLRDDDQSQLAGFVGDLGRQVERSTGYLRNNDFHGMVRDMEQLARGNTALFLGSTFVAGVAMGRFLRASEPQPEQTGGELAQQSGASAGFGGPGELGTRTPGGATGTRGSMGAPGEGGLIGDRYDSPRRNLEDV